MRELSLNILDIAQNSIAAKAKTIRITVQVDRVKNVLTILIKDDGSGMSDEMLRRVTDPFATTRMTRKVGMGLPLLRMGAEMADGAFRIESALGVGTTVKTTYRLDHIDRAPLGDLAATAVMLINGSPDTHFVVTYAVDGASFCCDTDEVKEILGGDVRLDEPEILSYLQSFITENMIELNGGNVV